jgi:glycerophosphoryl diester phosphodiesterase
MSTMSWSAWLPNHMVPAASVQISQSAISEQESECVKFVFWLNFSIPTTFRARLAAMLAPLVFAHRGASAAHRENTIEAFAAAAAMGADGVELDVRLNRDRLLVVHHDHDLVDGRVIADLGWADLPAHVPLLEPVIRNCVSMVVNVEIKNARSDFSHDPHQGAAHGVVELADKLGLGDQLLVSSFGMKAIDTVRSLDARIKTAFITDKGIEALDLVVERGHGAVHPGAAIVDEAYVAAAHERNLTVNVWTVDDPARIRELRDLGVDGIVTNVPDVAIATLGGR